MFFSGKGEGALVIIGMCLLQGTIGGVFGVGPKGLQSNVMMFKTKSWVIRV